MLLGMAVFIALLTCFVVLFISRFEVDKGMSIRAWLIMHLPGKFSELVGCDFCLCFWVSLILAIVCGLTLHLWLWWVIILPCLSTPIARFLL